MDAKSAERQELLEKYLEIQSRMEQLEEENNILKETNFQLARKLEEKDNAMVNLFSYIENVKK